MYTRVMYIITVDHEANIITQHMTSYTIYNIYIIYILYIIIKLIKTSLRFQYFNVFFFQFALHSFFSTLLRRRDNYRSICRDFFQLNFRTGKLDKQSFTRDKEQL